MDVLQLNRRTVIVMALLALLLVAAVVFAIGEVARWGRILHALERADRVWFPLCLLGEIVAYAGYVLAYRDVARIAGGPRFSYWTTTRVVIVGFGAFVAGSSAGTLGVDYWALTRAGEEPHPAARRVLALNTLEWGILAVLAALAGALSAAGVGGAPLGMALGWLAVVPLCVVAAAWVSSPSRVDRFTALPLGLRPKRHGPRSWPRWAAWGLRSALADAIGGVVLVRRVLGRPRRHVASLAGFLAFWCADLVAIGASLRAFDADVSVPALVLAYTTAYVVTALPLPAGGAGGVEAGLSGTLVAVGVPLEAALLATLVYRFFTLWLPICVALAFLPQVPRLAADLPRYRRMSHAVYASADG
jgi:uncharacterized membrane protein YbhN (UPF0104 family)